MVALLRADPRVAAYEEKRKSGKLEVEEPYWINH
jgi:hypothetical protein